jgi:hypothetical protein
VQDECNPLGRSQRVEHDEEGEADRIAEQRRMLRIDPIFAIEDWLRNVWVKGLLAPRRPRPQHVQTHAGDDRRQPSAQVLDLAGP